MHKTLLTAATLALALAGSAAANADNVPAAPAKPDVAVTFGNTVMSIYPDGQSQKIWMHPDGTWNGQSRKGVPLAGKWTVKGDEVCLRQSRPPTLPISFCQTVPKDPGVGLTSRDVMGRTIRLKLVRGVPAELTK